MGEQVQAYIDAIDPEHRPLFDRVARLVRRSFPGATVTLSYGMPPYRVGSHRFFVGVWKHGISVYGWGQGRADDFIAHHPTLRTSKGTIQLRPEDATGISDDELVALIVAALGD